jgi:hypothetical protein
MDAYLIEYLYGFMYGNDMLNRLLATEFFRYLIVYFEAKAELSQLG